MQCLCVGGSNAMGAFYEFIEDEGVELIGCEAAGHGVDLKNTQLVPEEVKAYSMG